MTTYKAIPGLAADWLEQPGHYWIRDEFEDGEGGFCQHGAIRACTPRKADAEIVRALARAQGYPESWNDEGAEGGAQVVAALRSLDTSDEAVVAAFGPQGLHVVALIRAAADLTEDQARQAATAWAAAWAASRAAAGAIAWKAAWDAARAAAGAVSAADAWAAAGATAWAAARTVAGAPAGAAAGGAAEALVVRHLIGHYGLTQAHYDTLTRPLRAAGITVHPDDKPIEARDDQDRRAFPRDLFLPRILPHLNRRRTRRRP